MVLGEERARMLLRIVEQEGVDIGDLLEVGINFAGGFNDGVSSAA